MTIIPIMLRALIKTTNGLVTIPVNGLGHGLGCGLIRGRLLSASARSPLAEAALEEQEKQADKPHVRIKKFSIYRWVIPNLDFILQTLSYLVESGYSQY